MENNNSVCFVTSIGEIVPIPGADAIELALAGGWQAIVQKDQYYIDIVLLNLYYHLLAQP